MDRVQTISRGAAIFKERCCRASYGVLCLEKYDPQNPAHLRSKRLVDPRDGKSWAEDQIDWFIKQVGTTFVGCLIYHLLSTICVKGEIILTTGILKPYAMKIEPGKEGRLWQTHVVMSTLPRAQLPSGLNQGGAKRLCEINSVLQDKGVDMKRKNRHWYNRGEQYVRARFNIKVILGAADIKFQLESKDQNVLSNDHDTIEVQWEDTKQKGTGADEAAMYREK